MYFQGSHWTAVELRSTALIYIWYGFYHKLFNRSTALRVTCGYHIGKKGLRVWGARKYTCTCMYMHVHVHVGEPGLLSGNWFFHFGKNKMALEVPMIYGLQNLRWYMYVPEGDIKLFFNLRVFHRSLPTLTVIHVHVHVHTCNSSSLA
jgi:hypothetical protein